MLELHAHMKYLFFKYIGMQASSNSLHNVLIGFY